LINLQGKWARRYSKIASILGSKAATVSASHNPIAMAGLLAQYPYGHVNNIRVLWPFYTPCDQNAMGS